MGEFEKGQNQDKAGQTGQDDKSAFQQLGDDKGEGGQQDIKTDSTSTAQAKPELTGAEAGAEGKQQAGEEFGQGKQPDQGKELGEDKSGGKFGQEGKEGQV
jgi:hypothetical protein